MTYTLQQNRMVKQMNRTLLQKKRAMLRTTSVAKSFLAKAVKIICYVINWSPSTAIDLKTPTEMWIGKLADFSHLHIFGSLVYVMYNGQERSKLAPKSREFIFLGYIIGINRYELWDPSAHKVVINRDVIFAEKKNFKWKKRKTIAL